jgi:hypothetical protein
MLHCAENRGRSFCGRQVVQLAPNFDGRSFFGHAGPLVFSQVTAENFDVTPA